MDFFRILRKILFLLLFFSLAGTGFGQQPLIGRLLGLSVTGNKVSNAAVIKGSSSLKEGQDVSWEDIQRAMKALWALGIFSDIQIVIDQRTPAGVFLTIKVVEFPKLDNVVISGNKKIKKEDIEKEVGFFRGQVLSPSQIAKAKKRLLKMYAEKGYTLAEINTRQVESDKEGRAILHLDVEEGKKVQIKRIQFLGNVVFNDGKLRKQMKKTKEDRWWRGADFDRGKYEEDKEKVLDFYRNNGYRDAEVVKDSLFYDVEKKDMFIDIWIREGHCYYVGHITWEGNKLFPVEHLASLLEIKEGDPFSQEKFTNSINDKIGGVYYDYGHIYAQINPKETLRGTDTLDVQFVIEEGNPVKIRKIHISGNMRTKDHVIRRELRIRPGDVFSKDLLMRSYQELTMLNYFSVVNPEVLPVDAEELDLSFNVEEKSTDTANLSAGWSELDRLIGSVGLGMNNLFGNGQQLSLSWNFGRFYRSFNLGFTEPWFRNTQTLIGANIYDVKRDPYYIGYSQRSQGISLHLGRRFAWPDDFFRGDWIYRLDKTLLSDFSDYYKELNPNNIVNEYAQGPLVSSGISQIITRSSLNHPEFPTAGSRISLSTEIAGGFLGGNVGYHKHIFKAEYFVPTFTTKLILLLRAQCGFMEAFSKSRRIPFLENFFMGGSGLSQAIPLRGYEDPLAGGRYYSEGGRTMLQSTMEIRFPIISNPTMYGLIFAEAGNTWLDFDRTDPFNLRRSVGIGARIFMPMVGILGFDYAYGFDQVDEYGRKFGAWKPQFVFGKGF